MEETASRSVCKCKQEAQGCTIKSKEIVNSRTEKITPEELRMRLKFSKDKGHNGDVVYDTPASERSLTALSIDIEEGEIIENPEVYAVSSEQECSHRFLPSTEKNVAGHKAISHDLKKRKHGDDTCCRLCGKNFPSMKSLCGHMRCHKRSWRGLSPPPEENMPVQTTAAQRFSLPATDFTGRHQYLPPLNRSAMPKSRGKRKAAAVPRYEEELELINASNNLLPLANVVSLGSTPAVQRQNRNHGDDLKISTQLDIMDVNSTIMDADMTEGSNRSINNLVIGCNNEKVGTSICQSAINERTKKMDSLEIASDLVSNRKLYLCSICDKSFSSYQALGGHVAGHKISKSNFRAGILERMEEAKGAQVEGSISQGGLPMKVSEHRCNICSLTFPTGQALGGHKRKHWPGPKNSAAPSSESAKKANRSCLDIDLNQPPKDLA